MRDLLALVAGVRQVQDIYVRLIDSATKQVRMDMFFRLDFAHFISYIQ